LLAILKKGRQLREKTEFFSSVCGKQEHDRFRANVYLLFSTIFYGEIMKKRFLSGFVTALCLIIMSSTQIMALNNGLARTPPMGFNTWNYFGCGKITDSLMRGIADVFISKGMSAVGYQYVNIDDCWAQSSRNSSGGLVAKPQAFPQGMRSLADYIHAKGLKLGIYTDVGTSTCATCYGGNNPQGLPGLLDHEQQDCDTFVAWGIDYVKVDYCCAGGASGGNARIAYTKVRDCLTNAVTRMKSKVTDAHPLVYSICNWGEQAPWTWGDTIGNLWRATGDINSSWASVLKNMDSTQNYHAYTRIGSWNDPDMMEVGIGDFVTNYAKARAHFSLWSMMVSPLIAGNDIRTMNDSIKSILINKDVIDIDQDTLGGDTTKGLIQGRRIIQGNSEVWVKLLKGQKNSDYAILFFNRGNSGAVTISVTTTQIAQLGGDIASGKLYKVRDLWKHTALADWTAGGNITSPSIPVNDVYMIRLSLPPSVATLPLASVKVSTINLRSEGESVIIHGLKSGSMSVKLVNLRGVEVYSQDLAGSMDCRISAKSLPRGVYIVNVNNVTEHFEQKVFL
jgi:alpha-galactosidase